MIVTVSRLIYDAIIGIRNLKGSLYTFPYVQFLTDLRTLELSVEVLRNEFAAGDYIQFLESRYDDKYDSWFGEPIIYDHIATLKYTNILPSLDERQNTALDIILLSVKNMRKLMFNPKRNYLYAEVQHIINLPAMLLENSGLAEYYLYVDKEIYLSQGFRRCTGVFEKLWKRMEKSMGDSVQGINHTLGVFDNSFDKIADGSKVYEVRTNDMKRRNIKIGDTITFYNFSDIENTVTVFVSGRKRYDTFRQAYMSEQNIRLFGGEPDDDSETMLRKIYRIYSKEEEIKYGVIVFKMELIEE